MKNRKFCFKLGFLYFVTYCFLENWDDHISHIDKVLERIQNARLTIKPAKCKFAQDSVKYLGHVVGLGKRSPAQLKVQTILDFPVPRTKTQVRAFLGIAGYYRQYIPMFSSLAAPLTELLKGKSKKGYIDWTSLGMYKNPLYI
ncbi:retrovirus-related Pol polyprotein from transposon 297 [Trichonephila inaurata madagascariensis]|uniref:Retrovirus-related Pol polyprotein from transposon 297 n=1 Tax=Trichonephila inaurata madagascariensis TaxID=2747483 RepID=A0A8X6XW99_9ARAC|nr:retrovirus-related Pol polyprotein from transposon 297 [Trichonephila inaurata madagascariensis]